MWGWMSTVCELAVTITKVTGFKGELKFDTPKLDGDAKKIIRCFVAKITWLESNHIS